MHLISAAAFGSHSHTIMPSSYDLDALDSWPDHAQPDTLGWRYWYWCPEHKQLFSPSQGTHWADAELRVGEWDESDVLRGKAGIHARRMPIGDWKTLGWPEGCGASHASGLLLVTGIVERFGKYVLGTTGWRAEWVMVKELRAPSTEIGLLIEQAYPDVVVHYPEKEDPRWISATSNVLAKGQCPFRSQPSPLPVPPPSHPFQIVLTTNQLHPPHPPSQSLSLHDVVYVGLRVVQGIAIFSLAALLASLLIGLFR